MVKFQLHLVEHEMLPNSPSPSYFKSENRFEYFKRTCFDFEQLSKIKKITEKLGMEFMVSPFSEEALDILIKMKVNILKLLLEKLQIINFDKLKTGKTIFMSTGDENLLE